MKLNRILNHMKNFLKGETMAEKLLLYYKFVKENEGLKGQMSLAVETKMPNTVAAIEPDSVENIAMFRKAVEKITGKTAPEF
jgi:hypothetical protein